MESQLDVSGMTPREEFIGLCGFREPEACMLLDRLCDS